jgi:AcrR family transcriptional regulator
MKRAKKRRGRRRGGGDARADIVLAARALFSRRGFRGTTTRMVAARAKVDVALLHYYFATKDDLFAAAIELPIDPDEVAALVTDGAAMARFHLDEVFVERREAVAGLLRAAIGDPSCVPALRKLVMRAFVSPPARALRGKDKKLRAELAGALVIGLFVCRHLVAIEPLASADSSDVIDRIGAALDALVA